jgi:S-methylmethionine-dependent homocysteine/selenocysteine methylase
VLVAGSLPPVFGSYRPDLFESEMVHSILNPLVTELDDAVDLWLIETTGSIAEATASLRAIEQTRPRPVWLSFTLTDDSAAPPSLRSGELVEVAVESVTANDAVTAVLFNCSQPEVMAAALLAARSVNPTIALGVYANAFPPVSDDHAANEGLSDIREDLTPQRYAEFAAEWIAAGASIIGGCCGIRPDHLAAVASLRR